MKFTIPYPANKKEQSAWNKKYGMNAIYAGKHWAQRKADSDFWHDLVQWHLITQKVPRKPFLEPVQITFLWNDNMDIDNHGYLGKMIVDGMKDYLLIDDDKKHYQRVVHGFHDKNYIEIEIEVME